MRELNTKMAYKIYNMIAVAFVSLSMGYVSLDYMGKGDWVAGAGVMVGLFAINGYLVWRSFFHSVILEEDRVIVMGLRRGEIDLRSVFKIRMGSNKARVYSEKGRVTIGGDIENYYRLMRKVYESSKEYNEVRCVGVNKEVEKITRSS